VPVYVGGGDGFLDGCSLGATAWRFNLQWGEKEKEGKIES